ncbi:MAG: leucine-rich repeat domain-containing protein, partial [Clostridia bacterium]|nr:leucine-rich repeat domain-containing protein [Clostridia bacterium]
NYAFYNCTALTEINYNAEKCADLASRNFVFNIAGQSGSGITVNIGSNVTKIPAYLFCPYTYSSYSSPSYAPNIISVVFNEASSCKSIGSYAFCNCISLTSITIPDSVTSIGSNAFDDCYKLLEVYNFSSLSIKQRICGVLC